MYRRIIKEKLSFSSVFSPASQELLAMLLEKDPAKRLTDTAAMKSHPFFKGIDWTLLYQKKITPSFVPPVVGFLSLFLIIFIFLFLSERSP